MREVFTRVAEAAATVLPFDFIGVAVNCGNQVLRTRCQGLMKELVDIVR